MRVVAIAGAVRDWHGSDFYVRKALRDLGLLTLRADVLIVMAPKPTRTTDAAAWAVVRACDRFQVAYEWRSRVELFSDAPRPEMLVAFPGAGNPTYPGHRSVYDTVVKARDLGLPVVMYPHPGTDLVVADLGEREAERRRDRAAT